MKSLHYACAVLALSACSPANAPAPETPPRPAALSAPSIEGIPAGEYKLDKTHGSLRFSVNHLGFSHYTAFFSDFDAALTLDPAHPELAKLSAVINPISMVLNAPPKGFHDALMGPQWLDAKLFPKITFASSSIALTGPNTADVTGDLTLHGVTKPVTMKVTFNGGYPGLAQFDPNARIGFSAAGVLKRSDFGIKYGIPEPGGSMGVSDEVAFAIETEFTGPPLAPQ